MAKADPEPGLVISYDYLWQSDKKKGWQEGGVHRPCVVVAVTATKRVLICGISRSVPLSPELAVELDDAHKVALGLLPEQQWIHCNEMNEISWDDPAIQPTYEREWEYGDLGDYMREATLERVRTLIQIGGVRLIIRRHD